MFIILPTSPHMLTIKLSDGAIVADRLGIGFEMTVRLRHAHANALIQ